MDAYDFNLYEKDDAFYVESLQRSCDILRIDRVTGERSFVAKDAFIADGIKASKINGILGTKRLLLTTYLVVLRDRELVGLLFEKHPVYKMTAFDVIPFDAISSETPKKTLKKELRLVSMLRDVVETPYMYYSPSCDITWTQQRLHDVQSKSPTMEGCIISSADKRFLWNEHLLESFAGDEDALKFCVPLMPGFIKIHSCIRNEKSFQWALISRRSKFRAGTRLYTRGIDQNGDVANFVEIEQIVWHEGTVASFVQTRGSIPLFWSQLPDFRIWSPPKVLSPVMDDSIEAFRIHVESQRELYGDLIMVNLIDHRGREENLSNAFAGIVQETNLPYVRYEPFDFHRRCAGMKYDNLRELLDSIRDSLDDNAFFLADQQKEANADGQENSVVVVKQRQTGVVRTNCIDSTDRTNVFQGYLARDNIQIVLKKLGIMQPGEALQRNDAIGSLLHAVWAENADICARQYAGSRACKNDFTKYGKRTPMGRVADAGHILVRYYSNHFYDGFRQDAINVFLGNHTPLDSFDAFGLSSRHASGRSVAQAMAVLFVVTLSYVLVRKGDGGILEPSFLLLFFTAVWHIVGAGVEQFLCSPKYSRDIFVHPDLM